MKRFALAAVAAAPLAAAFALMPSTGQEEQGLSRAEIEAVIRDYILANPEVILESVGNYQADEQRTAALIAEEAARRHLPTLISGEAGHAMGASPAEADVVVVEFFDYHCGFCRRAADYVLGLTGEDGVRVVFQDLPILREESRTAALAGLAAADAGRYEEMHRALMKSSGTLNEDRLEAIARRAGAGDSVRSALDDRAVRAQLAGKLDLSTEIAADLGIQGTPAFIVASPDGERIRLVPGYDPEAVTDAIEAIRARKQ